MLLGGYASEQLIFGDLTTGPSSDLERATAMARSMVTRYGMSVLGARTFGKKESQVFLGKDMGEEKNYSEKTAEDIDKEVSRLINQALETATKVLTEKRALLDTLASVLLKEENVEKERFDAIMKGEVTVGV
jgi:cell division protease FtsH